VPDQAELSVLNRLRDARILVTGACGFVGRHVVELGRRIGATLHAFDASTGDLDGPVCWQGDITDQGRVREVVQQVQPRGIIHLAAAGVAYGSGNLPELLRVNCGGLAVLLEAAAEVEPRPAVVCAGSGFEYAPKDGPLSEDDPVEPNSAYGVSKAAATMVARFYATRLPITILRLFSIYGPGEREPRLVPYVIQRAKQGLPIELTPGEQLRDYTYVGDVAEAFFRVLAQAEKHSGIRLYNVSSGVVVTLRQLVEALVERLRLRGLDPEPRFGARPYRADEIMHYAADAGRWIAAFGWSPRTSLRVGLERMLDGEA